MLSDTVKNDVDILLLSETKIDDSFPKSQFLMHGFSEPFRLDRTSNGGGLLLFVRNDIPAKPQQLISKDIECIILEINISNKKWLLAGIYNPNKSSIGHFLSALEINLSFYLSPYKI